MVCSFETLTRYADGTASDLLALWEESNLAALGNSDVANSVPGGLFTVI